MTIEEKREELREVRKRFECGSWNDLDVLTLYKLSQMALRDPNQADLVDRFLVSMADLRRVRKLAMEAAACGRRISN